MKYIIQWIDSYGTFNHRDESIPIEEDLQDNGVVSISGLKNLKKDYPIIKVENFDKDGWVDCLHEIKFEFTGNRKELKKEVGRHLDKIDRIIEVFSVMQEGKEEPVLTEEDY